MAINPNEISTTRVGNLPASALNLTDIIPHEVGTILTRSTIQDLSDFIANYIGAGDGLSFNPITILDGGTLPDSSSNEWILVGRGTFHNIGGSPDIITTEELNVLTSNGSFWSLSVQVPINVELAGIVQTIREGETETTPSEDAIFNALALKANTSDFSYSNLLMPEWVAGSYIEDKAVRYYKDGFSYIFASEISNNTSEPQLIKSTKPWTNYIGVYAGGWDIATAYVANDIVIWNSFVYKCITANTGQDPYNMPPPYWVKLGNYSGVFSPSTIYSTYDVVVESLNIHVSNLNNNNYALLDDKNHYWREIKTNNLQINCWGDSLTYGTGSTLNENYPDILSRKTGFNVVGFGVPGETSTEIKARFLARPDLFKNPTIIWAGRNNNAYPTVVKDDISEMVASLGHEKYLVLGIPADTTEGQTGILSLNSDLKAIYKDNFIDVFEYLVNNYNPSIPQDITDYGNHDTPFSLRSDWLHLNDYGYAKVAKIISTKLDFLVSNSQKQLSHLNCGGLQISGNNASPQKLKSVEIGYKDDVEDLGFVQAYDRVNEVIKPLSIGYTTGSETRINENTGVLLIGKNTNDGVNSVQVLGNSYFDGKSTFKGDGDPVILEAESLNAAISLFFKNSASANRGYVGFPSTSSANMFVNNNEGDIYVNPEASSSSFIFGKVKFDIAKIPTYADNTAAASLPSGQVYRTSTGVLMIKY